MKSRYLTALLIMLLSFSLTGCAGFALYDNTEKNVSHVQAQVDAVKLHNLPEDSAFTNPSRYTDLTTETGSSSDPAWLNQRVNVHGRNLSLDFLTNRIVANTGANVTYDAGTNPNQPAAIDYAGTIRGALNNLAQNTGYTYSINGNTILWSAFMTKTFDVSFMPGSSQYLMGQQANSGSGSSGTAGGVTNVSATAPDTQYSTLQGTLSVWQDLENTIKSMLSPDGKVMVSQATTTITVRDHPENVNEVQDYLTSMNRDLSRQVALQVQVLQINLKKAFEYGINWNMVAGTISANGGAADTLGNSLSNIGNVSPTGIGVGIIRNANGTTSSKFLLQALQQQGDLSVVTQPRVVTLNNQVARIAITTQRTYLASVTTTTTGGTTNAVQTSLNPGTVTTGFTMYVLPKIQGNDVLLQLTSELSNLDNMQQLKSSNANDANLINAPTVSSKSFNQRSMVPSGSTLVLAGFRQINNEANKASLFGIEPLGGKGAQQINSETIVLITPVVVRNSG